MRRVYINDWVPARRISEDRGVVSTGPSMMSGSRGVGAVVALSQAAQAARKGQKSRVGALTKPKVVNGPLAMRAEPTKANMRKSQFAQAQGVRGSGSQALWDQTFKMQMKAVIDGVTVAQKQLDDITSTMIGVDQQIADLQNAAGTSAPSSVQNAIDGLSQARQNFTQMLQPLSDTIDQMNAASVGAADLGYSPQIGSAPVQALGAVWKLVMAGSGSSAAGAGGPSSKLGSMIAAIQRSGTALTNQVNSVTKTVNDYVNTINAQAAAVVNQQQQDALTANLAQQLTTGQIQATNQAAGQQVTSAMTNAGALLNAGFPEAALATLQDPNLAQAAASSGMVNALSVAIGQANAAVQAKQLAANQAAANQAVQQGAYQPPQYGPVTYPPAQPPYPGGAQYAPQYYPPPAPAPAPVAQYPAGYQTDPQGNVYDAYGNFVAAGSGQQYYAPQANLVPVAQPQYDPTQYYQTPQYGGGFEDGPGAAGPEWTTYVEGLRGARGVGFDPVVTPSAPPGALAPPLTVVQPTANVSSAAIAQANARAILGAANQKIADARKSIELQRQADDKAKVAAQGQASGSWWTPAKKTLGALVGGLAGLGVAYEWGKRAK